MDLHLVWITVLILYSKHGIAEADVNRTKETDKLDTPSARESEASLEPKSRIHNASPTSTTETMTYHVTPVSGTQRNKVTGADVIFVLCIVTSCGLMLILLTLLSFVAVHYYRDKRGRDDTGLLDQTFASTTNLTEHSYPNGVENPGAVGVMDNGEASGIFIDTTMNGDVFYSNRNTVGHLKNLMVTRCPSDAGDIQYPALVHPSDIGLGRKKPVKPRRRRSSRRKHLIPIPEITTETAEDRPEAEEPRDNYFSTSVVHNPLVDERRSNGIKLVELKPAFERYLHPEVTEEVQYKQQPDSTLACLKSTSTSSECATNYNVQGQCVVGCSSTDSCCVSKDSTLYCQETSCLNSTKAATDNIEPILVNHKSTYTNSMSTYQHKDYGMAKEPAREDEVVEPPESYKDDDTYSIDFDDETDDERDEKENTANEIDARTEDVKEEHISSVRIVSGTSSNPNILISERRTDPITTQTGTITQIHNDSITLMSSRNTERFLNKDLRCNDKTFDSDNIFLPVPHYNRYHPGYSTVGHIKHKSKVNGGLHGKRKKSQSCPNSPLLGFRAECADIPAVTYIRSYPALNFSVQTMYGSGVDLDGDLNLSKCIDAEWEMRTTF